MIYVEDYLPVPLFKPGEVKTGTGTGVQIGKVIITDEATWPNAEGVATFSLLPPSTAFDAAVYPELAKVYPSLATPAFTTEPGSVFPYRVVADLVEVS